jgi:GntR family transcriptional regulator, transcriptional repressor for pyruvate dehydrogenase complex
MVRPLEQADSSSAARTLLFTHVRRSRSSDDVVAQIRNAIVDGRFKSGDRLPSERQLCTSFGVSRPTLREALRTLEVLGVIEIRTGSSGGIFASEPQGDQLGAALGALLQFRGATADELAEFRVSFESETARWAAERADVSDAARISDIAERFVDLAEEDGLPWSVLVELDISFHEALASASKNAVRVGIMLGIHRAVHDASSSIAPKATPAVRRMIGRELRDIADAVAAHDARRAERLTAKHVKKFAELERTTYRKPI